MVSIPFYNMVVLPGVVYYIQKDFYEDQTGKAPEKDEQVIFLVLRKDKDDNLTTDDYYPIGVAGKVTGVSDDHGVEITTDSRVDLVPTRTEAGEGAFEYTGREDIMDMTQEEIDQRFSVLKAKMYQVVGRYNWGVLARSYIARWTRLEEMLVYLSYMLVLSSHQKYQMLEADRYSDRFALMEKAAMQHLQTFLVSVEAHEEQQEASQQLYRESAIRKQIEILQEKLDQMHPENNDSDLQKFEKRIKESGMNETAQKEAMKVLGRMKQEGQNGHEYGMLYDYLDFVTGLSWKKEAFEPIDMTHAEKALEEDHFGLKKVKNRIIQQIAVMNLNHKQSGSILLFVGPPGTGKTSIGQSIARAMDRKYVRISLGGIRDEADIRGHRRTYIGAMPGRIMNGIRRSGVSNPVVVLDEVDKIARDYAGDPASALLEVLDPEQNFSFTDHYMNVPYDLSDVLFICTANTTDTVPEPLLNRMEVIEFQGYTETEKIEIAKKHLLPRAKEQTGIQGDRLKINDKAYHKLIAEYTMEAGVRILRRQLDTLCRIAAVTLAKGKKKSIQITEKNLSSYIEDKPIRHEGILDQKAPGIVTGLAWTQAGGDILFIETLFAPGREGKQIVTGQLGDVMKESVQIAVTLVKSMFPESAERFSKNDIHIHVPAGAVPKDGPSAGITMTTALASLITGRAVDPKIAMTGEVSLRGRVLPIGGLPEKLMAAVRSGVKKVFIPEENKRDLEDVAAEVRSKLEIIPVREVQDVLKATGILDEEPSEAESPKESGEQPAAE